MIASPRSNPHRLRTTLCRTLVIHPCLIQSIQSRRPSSDSKSKSSTINEFAFFQILRFFPYAFRSEAAQSSSITCMFTSRQSELDAHSLKHRMCFERSCQRTFMLAQIVTTNSINTFVCCWSALVGHQSCPRDAQAADLCCPLAPTPMYQTTESTSELSSLLPGLSTHSGPRSVNTTYKQSPRYF